MKISKGFISFDWIIKSFQEVKKSETVLISLPQFEGFIPAFFGRLMGKKIISIYHCEVILPEGLFNKIVEKFLNLSNICSLVLSDHIITYTKDFADHSKILPHFRSKLEFVYPPIISPKADKSIQKILMDKIDLKDQFVIGVAARLAAEKGIEYLFEALPQIISNIKYQISNSQIKNKKYNTSVLTAGDAREGIPNGAQNIGFEHHLGIPERQDPQIKIMIAGSINPVGERVYKEKILKLVEKYKDQVIFLGELLEEDMGSFYSLLDVLVLPSINSTEAFGMVQVEAMMTGVPVVATDLPGVRIPIQKTGMGLLVPIKDSQKLSDAIVKVLLNKKKYMKDLDLIYKEFSIKKTIEFYEKLLS